MMPGSPESSGPLIDSLDWWLTVKQFKISSKHMGPIFQADLRPTWPMGSDELEQELIYAFYTDMINSLIAKI